MCCHCRKRKSGDTCRFMNLRELFMKDGKYVGQRFRFTGKEESLEFGSFFGEDRVLGKHGSISVIKASHHAYRRGRYLLVSLGRCCQSPHPVIGAGASTPSVTKSGSTTA